ncbi:MAG: hypothetical protein LBM93_14745, partial [Oscillospiraceae bacterium]|jgi:flavodoxin|nr:hypothetical protein [Oscillospiraceae bacterium]
VPDGIEVSNLQNFRGIDLLISGHIHIPSPELVYDDMLNCGLFYVGSPTRIHEKIEQCWYMDFSENGENVVYEAKLFNLLPLSETWNLESKEITEEAALDNEQKRALSEILTEMNKYHIGGVNIPNLIRNIPVASDEAKEKAVEYYNKAVNNKKI